MILCDNLVHMNLVGSTGTPLTTALMRSGMFGSASAYVLQCSNVDVNACSAMAPSSGPLHAPLDDLLVNGTQFRPTDPYRAISYDHRFNFSNYLMDTTATVPATYRMTHAGWITFGAPDAGVSGTLADIIRFTTLSAGAYAILQLNNGNNPGYGVNIESLQSGGVLHSAGVTIVQGATYWCSLMIDCYNGITRAYVFDTSGNLVGSMKGRCTKTGASDEISDCRVGNSEVMTGTGTSYFEASLLDVTRGQFFIPAKYGIGYKKTNVVRS